MRLYELATGLEEVINGGMIFSEETGEIIFDSDNLDELEMALNDKLESCGLYIKNLEADVTALKNEIDALQARRKAAEGKVARMREYVLGCMEIAAQNRLETPKVVLSQRKSQYVEIEDVLQVPEDYKTIEEVTNVDKAAIKNAIKNGANISGCELKERINLHVK